MPRKIKVVDVLPETAIDGTVQQLDIDTDEPVEPIENKDYMLRNVPQQTAIIPETKVRTNEIRPCNKCGQKLFIRQTIYKICKIGL